MKKQIFIIGIVLSILVLTMFVSAIVVVEPPTLWEKIKFFFSSVPTFTIVGQWNNADAYPKCVTSVPGMICDNTQYSHAYAKVNAGATLQITTANARSYCGGNSAMWDVYAISGTTWTPRFEMIDFLEFQCGATNSFCGVELYCMPYTYPPTQAICTTYAQSRGLTGVTLGTMTATDPYMPLKDGINGNNIPTWTFCDTTQSCTGNPITCWAQVPGTSTCDSRSYLCDYSTYPNCPTSRPFKDPNGQQACLDSIQQCTTHSSSKCDNNDIYWYNSCGTKEDLKQDCGSQGCTNGAVSCTSTDCSKFTICQDCYSGFFNVCTPTDCEKVSNCLGGNKCTYNANFVDDADRCIPLVNGTGNKPIGAACSNDIDCASYSCDRSHWYTLTTTCQPIPWQKAKKMAVSRETIQDMTTTDLIKIACLSTTSGECITSEVNYTAKCIKLSSLKEDGTLTSPNIIADFFNKASDVINGGTYGFALGTGVGVGVCTLAITLQATTVILAPGAVITAAICTAAISTGAIYGTVTGANEAVRTDNNKDPLVQALQAKDDNSVGLCVLEEEGGNSFCNFVKTFNFFRITGNSCTDGGIIFAIIILFGIILIGSLNK